LNKKSKLAPRNIRSLAKALNIRTSTEAKLFSLGIKTPLNLLNYFPRRYIDYTDTKSIYLCKIGENVTIIGQIVKSEKRKVTNKLSACIVTITDDSGFIDLIWYGQPYLSSIYKKGKWVTVSGKIIKNKNKLSMTNPNTEIIEPSSYKDQDEGKIIPMYPLKDIIPQATFRSIIKKCLTKYSEKVIEYIPIEVLNDLNILEINTALKNIHFPINKELLDSSKNRFIFEKMFFNQLFMLIRRRIRESKTKQIKLDIEDLFIEDMKIFFPFELTKNQTTAIDEVVADLKRKIPMRRMLQGEVGSGKTIVALVSLFAVIRTGYQASFMAPTEILAEQHFINIKNQFEGVNFLDFSNNVISITMPGFMKRGMVVGLLLGNQPAKEKKLIQKLINNREIDLIIGTHSLFQENFKPEKMGLVVVDEQHKFGVSQRDILVNKSKISHLLSMSATPIPRSLALTLFGDLDISTLRKVPEGRKKINTKWCKNPKEKIDAYKNISKEIKNGRQVFIVCPLIHKSDKLNATSIEEKFIEISESILANFRIDVLHGEMSMNEKSLVMDNFKRKNFDILLATPVIEVGVDIPNATCMLIESADRFGLAQLHQIRGRVGRGPFKSHCYIFSNNLSETSTERLSSFEKSTDGFDLAEIDLKIRGPGDYIGSRQSGVNEISYEMITNQEMLNLSKDWAIKILGKDYILKGKHEQLQLELRKRFDSSSIGIS
jgi:ATP-dependent DNA helicase RecG